VADLLDNKYDSSRHCSKPTLTIKQDRLTAIVRIDTRRHGKLLLSAQDPK
jgi:hypothetical protein